MGTLTFRQMVECKKKGKMKEDHICWSKGRMQKKEQMKEDQTF